MVTKGERRRRHREARGRREHPDEALRLGSRVKAADAAVAEAARAREAARLGGRRRELDPLTALLNAGRLDADLWKAGRLLEADWTAAGGAPRVTARYPTGTDLLTTTSYGAMETILLTGERRRARFEAAMKPLTDDEASCATHVCLIPQASPFAWASSRGIRRASGLLVLLNALRRIRTSQIGFVFDDVS